MELVIYSGSSNLLHQFNSVRFRRRSILKTLIAIRADGAKVSWRVRTALRLVDDVSKHKAHFQSGVKWVRITSAKAAHLTRVTVSFENKGFCLFGNRTGHNWKSRVRFEDILSWLQLAPVFMRKDLKPEFISQFAQATCPL